MTLKERKQAYEEKYNENISIRLISVCDNKLCKSSTIEELYKYKHRAGSKGGRPCKWEKKI